MMQSLLRFFLYCWVVSLPFSCGNQKDPKVAIGDRLAGVKIMEKVPDSSTNFPANEKLFFLLNINNFNTYRTGSLQAYNVKNLTEPLVSEEIPSFATTLDVVHDKYLVLTFESSDDIAPGKMEVWEYAFDASQKLSLTKKKEFEIKRSGDEKLPSNYKKHPLQAINSILVDKTDTTNPGKRLILSCRRGELLVMDVSSDDVDNWKAPAHVRSYGEDAARPAMVVKDDFLILFPASPELRTQVPVGSEKYDKEEPLVGKKAGPPFEEGVPESFSKALETLKEKTKYYQLAVYDLREDLKFKPLNKVYVDETFWLHFNQKDSEAATNKVYLRTNFLRVRPMDQETFYMSRRVGKLHSADEHEILELKVADLAGFRAHKTGNVGKEPENQTKFDFLSQLSFKEESLFKIKDRAREFLKGASDEYMLYDFDILRKTGGGLTDPPEFAVISYKNSANYYGLLKGKGPSVSVEEKAHPHIKTSIRESFWGLLFWDDNTYVTAKNSYKKEAALVSGKLEATPVTP